MGWKVEASGRSGFSIRCPPGTASCKLCASITGCRNAARTRRWAMVFTVADLFAKVLRPIAEQRGLATWEQLTAYAAEEWYPSRIAFGKHKGKSIAEARNDAELRCWLDGLARSFNARNARMGRWYLRHIEETAEPSLFVAWECARGPAAGAVAGQDLVLYVNPELQRLRELVDAARARLAELEAGFTVEKAKVEAMKARLFARLRVHFQERDRLRLVISYRRKLLAGLGLTALLGICFRARRAVDGQNGDRCRGVRGSGPCHPRG